MAVVPILGQRLLLVEGQDEVNLFASLIIKLNGKNGVTLTKSSGNEHSTNISMKNGSTEEIIQIIEVGGKYKFDKEFKVLINVTGFRDVNILGIIRDADHNSSGAFQSVATQLRLNGFIAPTSHSIFSGGKPNLGVFILPDNHNKGMLEDLCLQSQNNHPVMSCVDDYMKCLSKKPVEQPKNIAKARSQTFLAAMPEIVSSVGLGAVKGYWNFDDNCFDSLYKFIGLFLK